MPRLRVGIGDILDVRPLAWGFLKGHYADLFSTEVQPLPLVGRLLARGELDVGLVPSVDAVGQEGLRVLPDLCVAFPGEALTLALVSPSPLPAVRRVYLGRSPRTSAVVLRLVLADRARELPELVDADPPTRGGGLRLRADEAALLIGDAALREHEQSPEGLHRLDLGTAWHELTGLPLVAGVWAVREDVTLPDLLFYFKSSLRYGLSCLDAIAREAAAELGLGSDVITRWLRDNLSYLLQDEEQRGLDDLVRRAAAAGAVPAGAVVRYWSP